MTGPVTTQDALAACAPTGIPRGCSAYRLPHENEHESSPPRLRQSPCPVGELADTIGMEQSAVSHQLRLLRALGLV
ncbi:ArsR family transcriptional regulator, partial [Actinocatenispora sera]